MGITTIIIISVLAAAAALTALIYWYAFIFEVSNFKLSEIEIFLKSQAEKSQAEKSRADNTKSSSRIFSTAPIRFPFKKRCKRGKAV